MRFNPHDYQVYCIERMLNEDHLGLFLNMGYGKTIITLTALNELITYEGKVKHALVIAPKRVAETTWSDETAKWDHTKHLRVAKILGDKKSRISAAESESDIYVINRENVAWLVETYGREWKWDCVIVDELSSFKNPRSKRFKALKRMLPRIKRLYGLTGTPAANGLIDLWSQIFLLDGGRRLGKTVTKYREKYFVPDKRRGHIVFSYRLKEGAEEAIRSSISDICISLRDSDYVELPERIDVNLNVRLGREAYKKYQELEREMLLSLPEGEITAVNAAVVTGKLLQIASGRVYDEESNAHTIHTAKLEALKELIEQAGSEPVLIFYNYIHECDLILSEFKQARELKTEKDVRDWNAGKISILIAHPASAAYGLNMQDGGHIIVWYSPTWDLERYEQANARLHRQGQTEPVRVIHIIAKDTIDEKVLRSLSSKDRVQTALLEALQVRLREVKDEDSK